MNLSIKTDDILTKEDYTTLLTTSWQPSQQDEVLFYLVRSLRKVRRLQKRIVKLEKRSDELETVKKYVSNAWYTNHYAQRRRIDEQILKNKELIVEVRQLQARVKELQDERTGPSSGDAGTNGGATGEVHDALDGGDSGLAPSEFLAGAQN